MVEGIWETIRSVSVVSVIISGIFGLIGGAITGIFVPLVNWNIEKRRDKRKRRHELIELWRFHIDKALSRQGAPLQNFFISDIFSPLQQYLSKRLVRDIENSQMPVPIDYAKKLKQRLLEEIARLERKWGLI